MVGKIAANFTRAGLVGAVAFVSLAGLGAAPARAGDDGAAPIWDGMASAVGLGKKDGTVIQYREHSKLVVPPKLDLPPPGQSAAVDSAWPVDQELVRARKVKELQDYPGKKLASKHETGPAGPTTAVEVSTTSGMGPGGGACLSGGKPVACPQTAAKADATNASSFSLNPMVWIGVTKKEAVLGPEPDRDFLTDPPKGFRDPVEGVGAKVNTD